MTKLTLNEQNYTLGSRPEVGASVCFYGRLFGRFVFFFGPSWGCKGNFSAHDKKCKEILQC